jgi:hypothetical protein
VTSAAAAQPRGGDFFSLREGSPMSDSTEQTRRLNDLARTRPQTVNASWVMTQGVAKLLAGEDDASADVSAALERLAALRAALAAFTDFSESNDLHGEHDFGAFVLFGQRLFWKNDYYHPDHDTHAPVPSNIELCRRILTVMLAEEY